RLEAWPDAVAVLQLSDGGPGVLYRLKRTPSYTLRGEAEGVRADVQHIALKNVRPAEGGTLLLSRHYQAGMEATAGGLPREREMDASDLVPLVRLRLNAPAARVILTWDGHAGGGQ